MNKKILIGVVLGVAIAIPLYLYLSTLSNTMSRSKEAWKIESYHGEDHRK